MRNGTPGFQPARLVEARESRGLTQVALADLIDRTPSSISRWEARGQSPEPQTLSALADSLKVPQSFFLNPPPEHGDAPMFFRSMASTTQMMRKRARARLRWAQDISLSIQEWVDLPEVDVPRTSKRQLQSVETPGDLAAGQSRIFYSFLKIPASWS